MFVRADLKQSAKQHLHRNLWLCIGVTIFAGFLGAGLFGAELDTVTNEYYFRVGLGSVGDFTFDFIHLPVPQMIASLVVIASLAFEFLIINPIKLGHARFFIENRFGKSSFETLFVYFNSSHYWNVVKIMLLKDIYIALWTLCFIIPGIIKSYEYFAVTYILAENPDMDSSEVFEISKQMTKGYKFEIFVLELSFILWMILVSVTLGIAALYVNPYILATYCEAYFFFKNQLLEKEIIQVDNVVEIIPENDGEEL